MKILFSEAPPDYSNYTFPYVVWGFPEPGDRIENIFDRGFLPSIPDMSRFYLCRQVRIQLDDFKPSSENRRILRKGSAIHSRLIPLNQFEFSPERKNFCLDYAAKKLGDGVMSSERFEALIQSKLITHVLVFTDEGAEPPKEVGIVLLHLNPSQFAYYYFSFYDLDYTDRSLGIFMMTRAVEHFNEVKCPYLYLGSVYTRQSLYKTNFAGLEFFNGVEWSRDVKQLKYLIRRGSAECDSHLLESPDFMNQFYPDGLSELVERFGIRQG